MRTLKTPLKLGDMKSLKCGDIVGITGRVFTARDGAHRRMAGAKKLPFQFEKSRVVFHAGPIMKKEGNTWKTVSLGPTTSSRMNPYAPKLIKRFGIRAIIGKGGMDDEVAEAMRGKCVYLAFTGGCAAVGAASVRRVMHFHWPEMGMAEGVWEMEVEKLGPLVVAIDSRGKSLYRN